MSKRIIPICFPLLDTKPEAQGKAADGLADQTEAMTQTDKIGKGKSTSVSKKITRRKKSRLVVS